MCFFAKIKYRVAYSNGFKDGPALFLTRKFFFLTKKHAIEKTFGVLEQINILDKNTKLEFYLSKKEKENLRKKLTSLKIKDYMIVHPSFSSVTQSNYPSRLWPLDRYAEITDYLIEKYKVKVFLTGMPNEKMISEKIKELAKNKKEIIVANELFELRELATLISNAKLLVSCGTGIVQIATAFDAPIVLFEGKGDSFETIPQNSKKYYRFLHHPEVCVGCEKESCRKKTIECMKAITVNEVKNAINEIIKENYS
jgi:ADP-heptose:LPS heptosyltransferase